MSLAGAGDLLFRYRNLLVPLAFVLVLVRGPRLAADPTAPLAAGVILAALGQAVRAVTIGLEYIVRGGRDRRVYAEGLVTQGIYSHTRNPMYVGNLLILSGVALASNSWICIAVAVPLAMLVYRAIVTAEERFLRGKFGAAYEAYARAVPRWALRFAGISTTLGDSAFHWRRLLVKEYGTTAAWILAICATGWIAFVQATGTMPAGPLRAALLASVLAAGVFWSAARWLKKSRTVVAD